MTKSETQATDQAGYESGVGAEAGSARLAEPCRSLVPVILAGGFRHAPVADVPRTVSEATDRRRRARLAAAGDRLAHEGLSRRLEGRGRADHRLRRGTPLHDRGAGPRERRGGAHRRRAGSPRYGARADARSGARVCGRRGRDHRGDAGRSLDRRYSRAACARSRSRRSTRRPAPIATLGIPPTRPDTGFGYIRLGRRARRRRAPDRPLRREARRRTRGAVCRGRHVLVEQRHFRGARERVARCAGTPSAGDARGVRRGGQGRTHRRRVPAPGRRRVRPRPVRFDRLRGDGARRHAERAVRGRRRAARRGLVGPRFVGRRLGRDGEGRHRATSRAAAWSFEGATSSYARSEGGRLVACVGTTNIIVVETDDAVLVADRSRVQDIKGLVSRASASSTRPKRTRIARCAARGVSTIRSTTATASR